MLLRTIIRQVGIDRTIAVTDATAAAGMGPGRYVLAGQEVVVGEEGAAWAPDRSHLVGSTATMADIRRVLSRAVGLGDTDVDRITVENPLLAIGGVAPSDRLRRSVSVRSIGGIDGGRVYIGRRP
jgi:N-acetylglucosamine-6-phosphate deacetylase